MLMKEVRYLFFAVLILLAYMHIGTGLYSDDYVFLVDVPNWTLSSLEILWSSPVYYLNIPFFSYYFIQFYLFENIFILYDLVKILMLFLSIVLVYFFLKDYMSEHKAALGSMLFILYPIHAATNYCPINHYMVITASLVMYAHALINQERYYSGFLMGILASFTSYASPPFFFGLSVIFFIEKKYKKFTFFVLPQLAYICYFYIMKPIIGVKTIRTEHISDPIKLLKLFVVQVATGLDAGVGPSFFLKLYYSIINLSLFSIVIGCIIIYLFYRFVEIKKEPISIGLLCGVVAVIPLSFGMFSLTGAYPQIVLGLGSRVTTYISLASSFFIMILFMQNKRNATIVFAIFMFSILGISDHWKSWHQHQLSVIEQIKNNKEIAEHSPDIPLYVSGNQFSQLGPLSNIEFLSGNWTVSSVLQYAKNRPYKSYTLNKRIHYKDGYMVDRKYNLNVKIEDHIMVYDSEKDKIFKIPKNEINEYISTLPSYNRHWAQMLGKEHWIRRIALFLTPRLDYLL
jgi:hypothetical protein